MTGLEASARAKQEMPKDPSLADRQLLSRYTTDDLRVFTPEEAARFTPDGDGDPRANPPLAWELLYRLEPDLYDRLARAERLHPDVLAWLPRDLGRIAEVGAGTGRLTLELVGRARRVVAVEPAAPLRSILRRKLAATPDGARVRVTHGFFDLLPLPDDWADLAVACSAFTPAEGHGGDAGLAEMERVCRPGGCVAIIWPNNLEWLAARGYEYVSFPGAMSLEFASFQEAAEMAGIFYPQVADDVRRLRSRKVPFELLGVNPPRDLAFKVLAG